MDSGKGDLFVAVQVSVLVMCHTRELAFQISKEYERFSKYMPSVKVGGLSSGAVGYLPCGLPEPCWSQLQLTQRLSVLRFVVTPFLRRLVNYAQSPQACAGPHTSALALVFRLP